ncbi:hypothetical protein MLD38_007774 [Melastoma candidum]|nr:hypothetical protein MLD38_007774 [Melastoma candidum]
MIMNMPYEGNDVVWSTLLRACRIQGDVEKGKRAAEQLLELEPLCGGTHIALANAYSAEGKWREAADVRKIMKSKGVVKELGWSWIMVGDLLSTFVACDQNHPQIDDICDTLTFLDMGEIDVADIDIY